MPRPATALIVLLTICSAWACTPQAPDPRPNILLIVADDLGYADLGSFGGEIETPNLDRLALNGLRFSNFIAAPTCSVSRAMMLTGVSSHKAGLGNMHEEMAPNQQGQPGYEGYLNHRTVTIASLLRDSGYNTYITGKWHLGLTEATSAFARGFSKSFTLLKGGASHYADMKPAYAPAPDIKAKYRRNGRLLDKLPENFDYSSQFYVDQMINYIGNKSASKPFFAYLAFTAPHWPLQAPDNTINKYQQRYRQGYDALARTRLQNQQALGLLPKHATLSNKAPGVKDWQQLSIPEQKVAEKAMAIYAAMVDEMDQHTGRLINHLQAIGELDNTVIIFLSDNGAEGHTLDQTWPMAMFPKIRTTINASHNFSYRNMGRPGSYTFYGEGWAHAAAPAFRLYKGYPTQGGIHVPAFIYGPGFNKQAIVDAVVSVQDLAPTILELAAVSHPGSRYRGRAVEPVTGQSLLPLLQNPPAGFAAAPIANEVMGKRFVQHGHWKLVNLKPPYGNGNWQLYNLQQDPAESRDLAASQPQKLQQLLALWQHYDKENNVILPDWVSGY